MSNKDDRLKAVTARVASEDGGHQIVGVQLSNKLVAEMGEEQLVEFLSKTGSPFATSRASAPTPVCQASATELQKCHEADGSDTGSADEFAACGATADKENAARLAKAKTKQTKKQSKSDKKRKKRKLEEQAPQGNAVQPQRQVSWPSWGAKCVHACEQRGALC